MPFRVKGLDRSQFEPLFALDDSELEVRGMRRLIAHAEPGFPCRVSLDDAVPGERVLLLGCAVGIIAYLAGNFAAVKLLLIS